MQLVGTEISSPIFMYSDAGSQEGTTVKTVYTTEVGQLYKVMITKDFNVDWCFDSIEVRHPVSAEDPIKFDGQCVTVQAVVFVPRPKRQSSFGPRKVNVSPEISNPDAGKVDDEIDPPAKAVDENLAGIDFQGGTLSEVEKTNMIVFSCGDTLDTFLEKLGVAEPAFMMPLHFPN